MPKLAVEPRIVTDVRKIYIYSWRCYRCDPPASGLDTQDYREAVRTRNEHNAKFHAEVPDAT